MIDRFQSLRYHVHKSEQIDKDFPELFRSPEFKKLRLKKDYQKIVKYIVFLYDKGTPLTAEYQSDLKARKEAAAYEAQFVKEGGKWPKELQSIMDAQDDEAVKAIMQYLKSQKNNIWMDINVTEQELYEFQTIRFSAIGKGKKKDQNDILIGANKKDPLMEFCDARIKRLETLYLQFYGDHKDIQESEYNEMITPENAMRIMDGTKPWKEKGEEEVIVQPVTENVS